MHNFLNGMLAGLAIAIAILLPATVFLPDLVSLVLLLGIYGSSMYGGAIPAILINTPGTPVNALTTYDGYSMTRRGEGPRALALAYSASFYGGMFSILTALCALILFGPYLRDLGGQRFGLQSSSVLPVYWPLAMDWREFDMQYPPPCQRHVEACENPTSPPGGGGLERFRFQPP